MLVIVPMRSGSSFKDKNIIDLFGKPLCWYTLNALQQAKSVEKVIVATDSNHYMDVVNSFGFNKVETRNRKPENADGQASSESVMLEFMDDIKKYPVVALAQVTNPYLTSKEVDRLEDLVRRYTYSALTGYRSPTKFYWHNNQPVNYEPSERKPRQQGQSGIFIEDGKMYVTSTLDFMRTKCRITRPFYLLDTPESIDVDSPEDLERIIKGEISLPEQKGVEE